VSGFYGCRVADDLLFEVAVGACFKGLWVLLFVWGWFLWTNRVSTGGRVSGLVFFSLLICFGVVEGGLGGERGGGGLGYFLCRSTFLWIHLFGEICLGFHSLLLGSWLAVPFFGRACGWIPVGIRALRSPALFFHLWGITGGGPCEYGPGGSAKAGFIVASGGFFGGFSFFACPGVTGWD